MNKKGFTLLELLGVIIILSLLALLTSTAITKIVKDSKQDLSDMQIALIKSSAELWGADNIDKLPDAGVCVYITLNNLQNEGFLDNTIIDPKNNSKIKGSLKIKISTRRSTNGNQIVDYEVNPSNIDICYPVYYEPPEGLEAPNLLNGLLTPVIYNGTNWEIADLTNQWYDYDTQWWANAVILKSGVSTTPGTEINVDGFNSDVYAMYVWVPRYEYNTSDAASASVTEIRVNFISPTKTTSTEGYKINSGFTFGNTNLSGIWVGKFETSHTTILTGDLNCSNENCSNADYLRIVPNVQSLRNNNLSNFFFASRSMGRIGNPFGINSGITDSHTIRNSEWGMVSYLSQSKYGKYGNSNYTGVNKEVYINNSTGFYTGRSGGAPSGSVDSSVNGTYTYEVDLNGTGASTTGNIYGVYDMSGGSWEHVMGVFANSSGELWSGNSSSANSGFTGKVGASGENYTGVAFPNSKYYDVYKASDGTYIRANLACNGGICYGHALNPEINGWYSDSVSTVMSAFPWFSRGGHFNNGESAGIMNSYYYLGIKASTFSFRLVLTEQ